MAYDLRIIVGDTHAKPISALRFSPDGDHIVSGGADGVVKIWETGATVNTSMHGHSLGVNDAVWSPDGRYIASASDDTTICLWDAATAKPAQKPLRGHASHVFTLAFNPFTNLLASGSYDEFVRFWDLRSGQTVRPIPAHSEPVTSVAWSPDGKLLASGSYDGLVRIWDASSAQCLKTLHEPDLPPVSLVRWSPNGRFVLACTLDHTVRLWDVTEGKRVKTYTGHVNDRLCVTACFAYGSDGSARIVCGSEDGHILAWDVSSRETIFAGHHTQTGKQDGSFGEEEDNTDAGADSVAAGGRKRRRAEEDPAVIRTAERMQHSTKNGLEGAGVKTEGEVETPKRLPVLCVDAHPRADVLLSALSGPNGSIGLWSDDTRGNGWTRLQHTHE